MGFVARVRRTLERRELLKRGRRVLVACSGGPDSSALLQALHELSGAFALELSVASVDHGLRPDAYRDLELARAHARALGLPFRGLRVRVDPGQGRQAGARAARYQALLALAGELGAAHVATGHTMDDQAETVVGRFLRSPSVRALSGIEPARSDGVVRPLIDTSRSEVLRFVEQRGIEVAADPSNRDPAYTRARVRHALLPQLLAENPRLVEALAWLAEDARGHQALLEAVSPPLDLGAAGAWDGLREQAGPVRRWLLATWIRKQTGAAPSFEQVRVLEGGRSPAGVLLAGGLLARWARDGSLCLDAAPKRTRGH